MELWETIRLRCARDHEPIKTVARELGLAPNTVRKYLRSIDPPVRQPRARPHKLDPFVAQIDELIRATPKITAVRVGSCLRKDVDPTLIIDASTLRKFVARRRALLVPKEAFIRAEYRPGDQAQFDFSPMSVILSGVVIVVQLFVMRLSFSGRYVARASYRCDRPALFASLLEACQTFGGTPQVSIFDNASSAVKQILRGPARHENNEFAAFRGGLMLEVQYAAARKGNEKGGVEGLHGFIEDNFFRPMPSFETIEELNVALAAFCKADAARTQAGRDESIAIRFERERAALNPLPIILPRACVTTTVHVNKFAEVRFENNIYSVPTRFAHRHAILEVYESRLRIVIGDELVADHTRAFGHGERRLDIRHYLDLLQHKHRAVESAAVLHDVKLSNELYLLLDRYRTSDPRTATKRWVKVLALLEHASIDDITHAVTRAIAGGTTDPEAIALLVSQRKSPVPSHLDPQQLHERARISVVPPSLDAYAVESLAEQAA